MNKEQYIDLKGGRIEWKKVKELAKEHICMNSPPQKNQCGDDLWKWG